MVGLAALLGRAVLAPVAVARRVMPRRADVLARARAGLIVAVILALLPPTIAEAAAGVALAAVDAAGRLSVVAAAPMAQAPTPTGSTVYTWGSNGDGQLGHGNNVDRRSPTQVAGFSGLVGIAGGDRHNLAVKSDGTVWSWGWNADGQLGNNGVTARLSPEPVAGLADMVAVAAGHRHSLALKADGTVWGWGWNADGQVGDGTTTQRFAPVQVGGLSEVTQIAAADRHALALKADGTVWAWGWNGDGQLGDGTLTLRPTPVQVSGLTRIVAVAVGNRHSLALKLDGTVWAWGTNDAGQLGDGTRTQRLTPVQVSGLTEVTAIASGDHHGLALKPDRTVWAWGQNHDGQLGDGTKTDRTPPVQVSGLTDVTTIAASDRHSLALRADGTVWSWAWNGYGQLGDGSTNERGTPGLVPNLTGVTAIAAAHRHSVALVGTVPSEPVPPGSHHQPPTVNGGLAGGGVHTLTGSYGMADSDATTRGRGPSPVLARAYNSGDSRTGPLGRGWTHGYATRLTRATNESGVVVLVGPRGRSDRYVPKGDGTFIPPDGVHTRLLGNADGTYTATAKDRSTWTFDGRGRLTAVTDRHGNRSTLAYDANGRLQSISDPAGRGALALGYDAATGRLTTVTDWLSPARVVRYGYDPQGRLGTVTDRENKVTTFGYDGATHHLATITDARNVVALTTTYDGLGRTLTQKDARGRTTGQEATFAYGADGATVAHPPASFEPTFRPTLEDTYDAYGQLTRRAIRPSSAETSTLALAYTAIGAPSRVTDPRNNQATLCWDVGYDGQPVAGSRGNLTRTIAPPTTTGAAPLVTLMRYDGRDNPIQVVPPKGVNAGATVGCTTDLTGSVNAIFATDLAYEPSGARLESTMRRYTEPGAGQQTAVTKYEYGDAANPGRVTRLTPPRGNTGPTPDPTFATTLAYFGAGHPNAGLLRSVTDALGNATTHEYDAVGRRRQTVDKLGNAAGGVPGDHTWQYEYDNEDRLKFFRRPAPRPGEARLVTEYRYDAIGNREAVVDGNGQITRYLYDERARLREVHQSPSRPDPATDPNKVRTVYSYDDLGNLQRTLRAAGEAAERATDYAHDGLGRVRRETQYPSWPQTGGTLVTEWQYDPSSNLARLLQPAGGTVTLAYDALDRLTGIDYSDPGTPDASYAYDAHSRRLSMTDGTGTTTYERDERGLLLKVTSPGARIVEYRYDRDGRRAKLLYPGGQDVRYSYDRAGRLEQVADWASRATAFQYEPDGRLAEVLNVNGTRAEREYDNARRLVERDNLDPGGGILDRHSYTLDAVGNRVKVEETWRPLAPPTPGPGPSALPPSRPMPTGGAAPGGLPASRTMPTGGQAPTALPTRPLYPTHVAATRGYEQDRLYRLTEAIGAGGPGTYEYDAVGNRVRLIRGGTTTTYTYDKADRITSVGGAATTVDANGNLTVRGADSFAYDQANRLTRATVNGQTTTFTYDGDGKRTRKVAGAGTTDYTYDVAARLPQLLDDGARRYVRAGGGPAYATDASGGAVQNVYHADGLGTVRALTDTAGSLTNTMQFDEFGAPADVQGPSAQPFGYTGEQQDRETGLTYLRARYYDPGLGRFMQRDPLSGRLTRPITLNRYIYADNNPVNYVDPSGLEGVGVSLSGTAEIGVPGLGAAVNYTANICVCGGGSDGLNISGASSYGARAGAGDGNNWTVGAFAGAGVGVFGTTATNAEELGAPSNTVSLDAGAGPKVSATAVFTRLDPAGWPATERPPRATTWRTAPLPSSAWGSRFTKTAVVRPSAVTRVVMHKRRSACQLDRAWDLPSTKSTRPLRVPTNGLLRRKRLSPPHLRSHRRKRRSLPRLRRHRGIRGSIRPTPEVSTNQESLPEMHMLMNRCTGHTNGRMDMVGRRYRTPPAASGVSEVHSGDDEARPWRVPLVVPVIRLSWGSNR